LRFPQKEQVGVLFSPFKMPLAVLEVSMFLLKVFETYKNLSRSNHNKSKVRNIMPKKSKDILKSYFNTGDVPNESNYFDLIDSMMDQGDLVGVDRNKILILHVDRSPISEYLPSQFVEALTSHVSGDIYLLPNGTIDGDYTIPEDVAIVGADRKGTTLTGLITLSNGSELANLKFHSTTADAISLQWLLSEGDAYVIGCDCLSEGTISSIVSKCVGSQNLHYRFCSINAKLNGGNVNPFGGEGVFLGQTPHYYPIERLDREGFVYCKDPTPFVWGTSTHWRDPVDNGDKWIGCQVVLDHNGSPMIGMNANRGTIGSGAYYYYRVCLYFQAVIGVPQFDENLVRELDPLVDSIQHVVMTTLDGAMNEMNIGWYWPTDPNTQTATLTKCWDWMYGTHEIGKGLQPFVYSCEMPVIAGEPEPGDRATWFVTDFFELHSDEGTKSIRHLSAPTNSPTDAGKSDVLSDNGTEWVLSPHASHEKVTVTDTSSVNLTIDPNQILSADVIPGGIKLNELGNPTDNADTRLLATVGHPGLVPNLTGKHSDTLHGDGVFSNSGTVFDFLSDLQGWAENHQIVHAVDGWTTEDPHGVLSWDNSVGHTAVGSLKIAWNGINNFLDPECELGVRFEMNNPIAHAGDTVSAWWKHNDDYQSPLMIIRVRFSDDTYYEENFHPVASFDWTYQSITIPPEHNLKWVRAIELVTWMTGWDPRYTMATWVDDVAITGFSPIKTGSGGGASAFTDLTDTPHSYAGMAGKIAKVNEAETGLEFSESSGGTGGGHVIEDVTSILPQETNLKFTGGVTVTDDPDNHTTIIDISGATETVFNLPRCNVRKSEDQLFTYGGAITWDIEDSNTDNIHSNTVDNSRFTCHTAGWYRFTINTQWTPSDTGSREIYTQLTRNDSSRWYPGVDRRNAHTNSESSISSEFYMHVGEYVEALVTFDGITSATVSHVDVTNASLVCTSISGVGVRSIYPQRGELMFGDFTVTHGNPINPDTGTGTLPQQYKVYFYQNGPADGDSAQASILLKAGTYTFSVLGMSEPDAGIDEWYMDDDLFATQDWYSSNTTANVVKTATFTVAYDGRHILKIVVNGKSGSNYYYCLTRVSWVATDETQDTSDMSALLLDLPGLKASPDIAGRNGSGICEEFNLATDVNKITWDTAPEVIDTNTTAESHLYLKHTTSNDRHGSIPWAPTGDFDARMKIGGIGITSPNVGGWIAFTIENADRSLRVMTSMYATTTAAQHVNDFCNVQSYVWSNGAWVQQWEIASSVLYNGPIYFRIQRIGSTVYFYYSSNGLAWRSMGNQSYGFTVANIGFIISSTGDAFEAYIDWLRTNV
jgi:hypothetical protein